MVCELLYPFSNPEAQHDHVRLTTPQHVDLNMFRVERYALCRSLDRSWEYRR